MANISIHAPARGATGGHHESCGSIRYFNPRSRERSDDCSNYGGYYSLMISIHAPARGATGSDGNVQRFVHYFNPRSRERSDKGFEDLCNLISISIHAPARGATVLLITSLTQKKISIHAPARGATIKILTL